jgi:hypothetical protein
MAEDASGPNAGQPPPLHIHRPIPRRNFATQHHDSADSPSHAFSQATPPSATETRRSSDFLAQLNARLLRTYNSRDEDADEKEQGPPRNKSFLNMTSSTLYGIYDDVGSSAQSITETPWGTGAETPAHPMAMPAWESGMGSPDGGLGMKQQDRRGTQTEKADGRRQSHLPRRPRHGVWKYAVMSSKLAALFLFGVVYGLIVSHLHDTRQLAAVHVPGVGRESWVYVTSWGVAGVALGSLLPYVDLVWGGHTEAQPEQEAAEEDHDSPMSEQINDVVRSVAAFVGIAFAIVSSLLCRNRVPLANAVIAAPALAVHPPAHSNPRPRQPSTLVHPRSLKARALVLPARDIAPHILDLPLESRGAALAFAITSVQRDATTRKQQQHTRSSGPGGYEAGAVCRNSELRQPSCCDMGRKCVIL